MSGVHTARSPNKPSPAVKPTNNITTLKGVTVRTRLDPALTVDEVIRLLVENPSVKLKGNPSQYVLRDAHADALVTNENLRQKIRDRVDIKLVHSPERETKETAQWLKYRCQKMRRYLLRKVRGMRYARRA